jgi:hypothetical protein
MALAFVILAHKNARQVARLFRAVHRSGDVVVLHFDRRADPALHRLGRELARTHSNVVLLRSRSIFWGGYQIAAVQIEAIAAALRISDHWHHFINLTGQDFPIKPIGQLDAYLAAQPNANYVSWFDPLASPLWQNARERLTRYYFEWPWLERVLRLRGVGRRLRQLLHWQNQLPHIPGLSRKWPEFQYYGGANQVVLSRSGARYLSTDPAALRIVRWLKHAALVDEIVFQTVLLNGPLAPTVINDHLHEIDFPAHSPHPRTFRSDDFDRLVQSPDFFARKFDEAVDAQILDRLTQHLEHAESTGVRRTGALLG